MKTLETSSGTIAYRDEGEGSPIVLLHATLHDHHDYDLIFPRLASRHRTIAVDWPGHGESAPNAAVTAEMCADTLEKIVDKLDLPPAVFIGNSVGGFAAARLAVTKPSQVAGLVLVNTGGFLPQHLPARAFCRVLGTAALAPHVFPRFIAKYMRPNNELSRSIRDNAIARAKSEDGAKTVASMWRSFGRRTHDLSDRAGDLRATTLIVWGEKDTAIPLSMGRRTHSQLPDARFETIDAGHVVFANEPDRFLELVEPFIESLEVAPIAHPASS